MPRWVYRFATALVLSAAATLLFPASAPCQDASVGISSERSAPDFEELLRRGSELERERRWADALVHYEDALRAYPNEPEFEQRSRLAKIHYSLSRRYHDASFRHSVDSLSERDALGLYAEVLLKIRSHYVDTPDWQGLIDVGTTSLEVACTDPVFVDYHLKNVPTDRVERFRRSLRQILSSRQVRDRNEAREAVRLAAQLGAQQLQLPASAVVLEYTCGATNFLDEYSAFLTADQLNEVYSQIDGNFVGLGVELKADAQGLLIVDVIRGSPAERGGILPGDRIIAVDGQSTETLNTDAAADLLQGPEGSTVEVVAVTGDHAPRKLMLRREQVEVPSVDNVHIADPDRGIAYLKITCFQKTTTRDIDAALWQLHREGMRSLIIDLRGNPGGLLTSSVEVADKFVQDGKIVSTKGRDPREDFEYSAHRAGTWHVPLVVLIDGDSASASEIFAGAIRDHRRGTIVGTRSYGKGSVQGIFPLNFSRAGLRLTTAKFYSPKGQPYSNVGVQPDVYVQQVARPAELNGIAGIEVSPEEEDPILSTGLQVARQQMARR